MRRRWVRFFSIMSSYCPLACLGCTEQRVILIFLAYICCTLCVFKCKLGVLDASGCLHYTMKTYGDIDDDDVGNDVDVDVGDGDGDE